MCSLSKLGEKLRFTNTGSVESQGAFTQPVCQSHVSHLGGEEFCRMGEPEF